MTDKSSNNQGLAESLAVLFNELQKPIKFEFHSIAMTEDGQQWQALFNGDDGHNQYINTPDANSFRKSGAQIAAEMQRALNRGRRIV